MLGPMDVVLDGTPTPVGPQKQQAVLALLVAQAGRIVSTEALMEGVWGDPVPDGARRSLQTYISNLRRIVGDLIRSSGSGYLLDVRPEQIDAGRFESLVRHAEDAPDHETEAATLRTALELWRGHPYAGVDELDTIRPERTRLEELRIAAIERRIEAELELGRHASLVAELEGLADEHRLREHFHAQLMLALYRSGRQPEALRAYARARTHLADETGLEPSPELRRLEQQIFDRDPGLSLTTRPSIRKAVVFVADVVDPLALDTLTPSDRDQLIAVQNEALTDHIPGCDGAIVSQRGTAVYAVFDQATDAARAAVSVQKDLAKRDATMRIALTHGDIESGLGGEMAGPPFGLAAALVGASHPGQVLLSANLHHQLATSGEAGFVTRSLGDYLLSGVADPVVVHQLVVPGVRENHPPLRTAGTPAPLPAQKHGIAGYKLREEIGTGLFGVVHRGYQASVGREVAVKVIRSEFANNPEFVRRFEIEAQLVARLEHPNIVPLYDYWREPDAAYLVMRWMRGGSLQDRLEAGTVTPALLDSVLRDVGVALDHAHHHGVVHRDIKPTNILLDDDDRAYVADFGIARQLGTVTPVDASDDIGALGVLLRGALDTARLDGDLRTLATRAIAGEFESASALLIEVEQTREADGAALPPTFTETRNPYKGLLAFKESDAPDFFGRDAEIEQLLAAGGANRLVAVVGPSGIGKSSVVRAGLIPALRSGRIPGSDQWFITDMIPGSHPFEELASALLRVAVEPSVDLEDGLRQDARGLVKAVRRHLPEDASLVLVIDQFEELFTLVDADADREAFLSLLTEAVNDERADIRIVATIRADFFDRPLRHDDFGNLLRERTVPIAAPTEDSLREMIQGPAHGVGITLEAELMERIVTDVKGQAGSLPLLEYSLTELFSLRSSDRLSMTDYVSTGGVLGALSRRAETVFQDLRSEQQELARQIFLRLVNVDDSGRDTRRRARRPELYALRPGEREAVDSALTAFGSNRLLTFDRDTSTRTRTVEVAHEALLSRWPRLSRWIDDRREDLLLERRLAAETTEWLASGRDDEFLLGEGRLQQFVEWSAATDLALTPDERHLIERSSETAEKHRTRRRTTRRRVLSGFAVAAAISMLLAALASTARTDAQDKAALAESSRLATAAVNVLGDDPELALLLSVASAQEGTELSFEQTRALHAAIDRHSSIALFENPLHDGFSTEAKLSPDGSMVIVEGQQRAPLTVRSVASGEVLWALDGVPEEWAVKAGFTADGKHLGVEVHWLGFYDWSVPESPGDPGPEGVYLYDATTFELIHIANEPDCASIVGTTQVFIGSVLPSLMPRWCWDTGEWWLVDPVEGTTTQTFTEDAVIDDILPSTNGSLMQVITGRGINQSLVDVRTGERWDTPLPAGARSNVSSTGRFLQAGPTLVDPRSGETLTELEGGEDGLAGCHWKGTFSVDDGLLALGCQNGEIHVFDTSTGRRTALLIGHSAWVFDQGFDASGTLLASGAGDEHVRVWNLGHVGEAGIIEIGEGYKADAGLTIREGSGVALVYPAARETLFHPLFVAMTSFSLGELVIFDEPSHTVTRRVPGFAGKIARISPDGSLVAAQSAHEQGVGNIRLVDMLTGEIVGELPGLCVWEPPAGSADHCDGLVATDAIDLAWSPDGRFLAMAGGAARSLMVWDVAARTVVFSTEAPERFIFPFSAVTFSNDGSLLAVSSKTGMWVYDTATWELVTPMITHTGRPSWVMRFTPDDTELVTAQAHSGDVRIYNTTDWGERDIRGGPAQTRDMALSSKGDQVALVDREGDIHVLDLASGDLIELISLDDRDITNVEFIDGDSRLLITSSTGPVEIITLDHDELVQIARSRISRTFTSQECEFFDLDPCPTIDDMRGV